MARIKTKKLLDEAGWRFFPGKMTRRIMEIQEFSQFNILSVGVANVATTEDDYGVCQGLRSIELIYAKTVSIKIINHE